MTDMDWLLSAATQNHGYGPGCKRGCLAMMTLARPEEASKLYRECRQLKDRVDDPGETCLTMSLCGSLTRRTALLHRNQVRRLHCPV